MYTKTCDMCAKEIKEYDHHDCNVSIPTHMRDTKRAEWPPSGISGIDLCPDCSERMWSYPTRRKTPAFRPEI